MFPLWKVTLKWYCGILWLLHLWEGHISWARLTSTKGLLSNLQTHPENGEYILRAPPFLSWPPTTSNRDRAIMCTLGSPSIFHLCCPCNPSPPLRLQRCGCLALANKSAYEQRIDGEFPALQLIWQLCIYASSQSWEQLVMGAKAKGDAKSEAGFRHHKSLCSEDAVGASSNAGILTPG